jgi:hypothetical protein
LTFGPVSHRIIAGSPHPKLPFVKQ